MEAHLVGNGGNVVVCLRKQLTCNNHSVVVGVVHAGKPCELFEQFHQVEFAVATVICKLFDGNFLVELTAHKFQRTLDCVATFFLCRVGHGVEHAVGVQQVEHLVQVGFDVQFGAVLLRVATKQLVEAVFKLFKPRFLVGNFARHRVLFVEQRSKVFQGTVALLASKQSQVEHNCLNLHVTSRMAKTVHCKRTQKENVALPSRKPFAIHANVAVATLNFDNFNFFVPMNWVEGQQIRLVCRVRAKVCVLSVVIVILQKKRLNHRKLTLKTVLCYYLTKLYIFFELL